MKRQWKLVNALPLVLFVLLVGVLYALLSRQLALSNQAPVESVMRPLPAFSITGLKHTDIKGPALLHFTASWCAVCKIEHPALMQMKAVLPIYGVAWKDDPAVIQKWLEVAGNPYVKWGVDTGKLGLELGLTGTPESFLISAEGNIIAHFKGPLTDELIEQEVLRKLK